MAVKSPRNGLLKGVRGWQKYLHGRTIWVAGFAEAPTAADADRIYDERCDLPPSDPRKIFVSKEADERSRVRGRARRPEQIAVRVIANAFLTRKEKLVEAGRLDRLTCDDYFECVGAFVAHVGDTKRFDELLPRHFGSFNDELHARLGVTRRARFIVVIRSMFKWAGPAPAGVGLVDALPNYGGEFGLPSRAEFRRSRKHQREKFGVRRYEPAEIREQLDGKPVVVPRRRLMIVNGKAREVKVDMKLRRKPSAALRAMILLGINGGFGNKDCAYLRTSVVQPILDGAEWMEYARGKTGAERMFWIWPETRAALAEWSRVRGRCEPSRGTVVVAGGEAVAVRDLFFLTQHGLPWIVGRKDQVAMRYAAYLQALGQTSRGFRSLRRTARTVAAETGQELAIDLIMGHADDPSDMAKVYTVELSREVVKSVCQHVRSRLLFSNAQPVLPFALASAGSS